MERPNLTNFLETKECEKKIRNQMNRLANQLIIDCNINEGNQIASFLHVSQGIDNYSAIRGWVETFVNKNVIFHEYGNFNDLQKFIESSEDYLHLKQEFLSHFPETLLR